MRLKYYIPVILLFWVLLANSQNFADYDNNADGLQRDIPSGYYDNAIGKTGAELKTALYNIIKGHTALSYTALWSAFQTTDKRPDGKVWDMYSNCVFTFVTNQCGNYSSECDCYNREHSMPKSWFNDGTPMYTDLFHLVPTDGYVNNRRGNYPFGTVANPTYVSGNGSKLGPCSFPGYTGTVFEPVDEYKGDFARGYLYMATRYENVIASWENYDQNGNAMLNGTSYPCYEPWAINLLLTWHQQDPVSAKEIARNEAVYVLQHNRNPYIDHPEWVQAVWNPGSCSAPTVQATNFTASAIGTTQATVSWTRGNGNAVMVFACKNTIISFEPSDGTSYTASTVFGNGQQPLAGLFAVYSGSGNSVTVENLEPAAHYYFMVYEFNTNGLCYLRPGLQGSIETVPSLTIVNHPENQIVCQADDALFSVTAQGEGNLLYQWYFNDVALEGQNDSNLFIENAAFENEGEYYCEVSDNYMTLMTNHAVLEVEPLPFAGNDTAVIVSDTVALISLNELLTTGASLSGIWTDSNFNVIANPYFSPSESGEGHYVFYYIVDINVCQPDTAIIFIHVEHYAGIKHQQKHFSLFPNPFGKTIYLVFENQTGLITISSVTGQVFFQQVFAGFSEIDASKLGQGIYIVSVKTGTGYYHQYMIKKD